MTIKIGLKRPIPEFHICLLQRRRNTGRYQGIADFPGAQPGLSFVRTRDGVLLGTFWMRVSTDRNRLKPMPGRFATCVAAAAVAAAVAAASH